MLVEISVVPMGPETHSAQVIARCVDYLESQGARFELTPGSTLIEGAWDEVMPLVKRCHDIAREASPHVVTIVKIEDEEGVSDKLDRNVASVREKQTHAS
jgi:uncharacterized protein (TIGR00106 family)